MPGSEGWPGKPANLPAVVPPCGALSRVQAVNRPRRFTRDASGRFLAGNGRRRAAEARSATGSPKPSSQPLVDHFAEHGKAAFDKLATDDRPSYLRIMASFVPREPARGKISAT